MRRTEPLTRTSAVMSGTSYRRVTSRRGLDTGPPLKEMVLGRRVKILESRSNCPRTERTLPMTSGSLRAPRTRRPACHSLSSPWPLTAICPGARTLTSREPRPSFFSGAGSGASLVPSTGRVVTLLPVRRLRLTRASSMVMSAATWGAMSVPLTEAVPDRVAWMSVRRRGRRRFMAASRASLPPSGCRLPAAVTRPPRPSLMEASRCTGSSFRPLPLPADTVALMSVSRMPRARSS